MKKRRRKSKTRKKRLSHKALDIILFGTPATCCLTVDCLARKLGVLSASLSRAFKRDFKCDLKQFLLEIKLTWSILLIMNMKLSIKEVADFLEFESHRYFERLYRNYFGITPDEARNYYMVHSGFYLNVKTEITPEKKPRNSRGSNYTRRITREHLIPLLFLMDGKVSPESINLKRIYTLPQLMHFTNKKNVDKSIEIPLLSLTI